MSDFEAFDLQRMFVGDANWQFTLEVVVRTLIMYSYALLLIRFLGKRGRAQLSPFEFVIIISLGSAVGDPMFVPDVPLVHSMVVIALVVILNRALAYATEKNDRLDAFIESETACLVRDGRLLLEGMRKEQLSKEELFSSLREAGVEQLGQVKRAYLEPSGRFTSYLYPPKDARPGLPLYPACDDLYEESVAAGDEASSSGNFACRRCGETLSLMAGRRLQSCPVCNGEEWTGAMEGPALQTT